jgi:UDP-N-acetylglucosamine 4,6-dehydratase
MNIVKALTSSLFIALPGVSRVTKTTIMIVVDGILLPVALYASYVLRLGEFMPPVASVWWLFLCVPLVAIPILAWLGVYRAVMRYIGLGALVAIGQGMLLATLILSTLVFLLSGKHEVPRSVLPIFYVLSVLMLSGGRLLFRNMLNSLRVAGGARECVAIYGAGEAGRQLANALANSREFHPLLFLDDAPALQGREIQGLLAHDPQSLPQLIARHDITRVLVAMPSISRSRQREILEFIEPFAVKVMVMPGLSELADGRRRVDDLREVGIEDLLGRESVAPNPELLRACISEKNVMVTGAGGSIGAELCRQILTLRPRRLVLFEISELALYSIERELREQSGNSNVIEMVPVLGSVQDRTRLEATLRIWRIDTVYHAAAYKHVPLVEHNPIEGLRNNSLGTLCAAQAARAAEVETFVLISTDKAVRPTNVMGASKRLAELILQAMARLSIKTRFCMVRFGNVLASSGSVVPLFREQIRRGGPVTVTHPEMLRYFMTIPEAAQLVIQAGSMSKNGEVFVLDMGVPVRIRQLAERMIHLSGLSIKDARNPAGDIEIIFTGLRPGEKLYEELLISETDLATVHPRIRSAQEDYLPWAELEPRLKNLSEMLEEQNLPAIQGLLKQLVHGYEPRHQMTDNVWAADVKTV